MWTIGMAETMSQIKCSELKDGYNLLVNSAGDYVFIRDENLDRLGKNMLTDHELSWLEYAGFLNSNSVDFFKNSLEFKSDLRNLAPRTLSYILIIPTLRCNLSCSYCQVSRANENAQGYDWTDEIIDQFMAYVSAYASDDVKIEFQGGEPTLRMDIVEEIVIRTKNLKPNATFVICTNLSNLSQALLKLIRRKDFFVSSSLDGPPEVHKSHRTLNNKVTSNFFGNLDLILEEFGTEKISLLPTIVDYKRINETIDFFYEKKLPEIFLRPVNYQGFARKKFLDVAQDADNWSQTYEQAIQYIAEKNLASSHQLIETNLSIHLNRIFRQRSHSYVDFRNPNFLAQDYIVVDFDGKIYPTDESRMLSRIGLIDLSIGDLETGIDNEKCSILNSKSSNHDDPICNLCSYQSFCGVDTIDNISRYGTVDIPTNETYFCKTHLNTFDFIFSKLSSRDNAFLKLASLCLTGKYAYSSIFGGHHFD